VTNDREEKQRPAVKHRDGLIEVAVWERQTDKGTVYNTERTRSYQDQDGKWRKSHSIPERDILKAARLDHKAYESIRRLRERAHEDRTERTSRRRERDERER